MERDATGCFIKGHKQLATNQQFRVNGKFVSWSKVSKDIDSFLLKTYGFPVVITE